MKQAVRTKILCTVGPRSKSPKILRQMIENGADGLRINLSHTPIIAVKVLIKNIRSVSKTIPLIIDTQGKETRIGKLGVDVKVKRQDIITVNSKTSNGSIPLQLSRPDIINVLEVGDTLFVDDNNLKLVITNVDKKKLSFEAKVLKSHILKSFKNIKIRKECYYDDFLTPLDKEAITYAKKYGLSEVALSYVETAKDVEEAKKFIGNGTIITSKIERMRAIDNITSIIAVSDNLSIDRYDLGAEIGYEKVPRMQKFIIRQGHLHHRPVFIASHLLETMITKNKPTRGEVNDIVNTVLDGANALILSSETAVGENPPRIVKVLRRIVMESERFQTEVPLSL